MLGLFVPCVRPYVRSFALSFISRSFVPWFVRSFFRLVIVLVVLWLHVWSVARDQFIPSLIRYGGIENYTKKVKSVRDRLKAQAYQIGGGVDIQQIFERIFAVRDTDGSGSIELDEWTIICRKDLKMPRFMLKDWEVSD